MSKLSKPKGMDLPTLVARYHDEDSCREYLEAIRWPDGPLCPRDEHKAYRIGTAGVWECSSCGYQFTVRVGTVLQDSKLPLSKWLIGTLLMVESKKGMSANQLRRTLGTTYRTAWHLSHRIREAMSTANGSAPLTGTVEVDETYIGGKRRHVGRGYRGNKTMVLGAVERGGGIRLRVEPRTADRTTLHEFIGKQVHNDATAIYTDQHVGYVGIGDANTKHESVNHHAEEWVRGDVHTNTIESAWSLFKRSIVGSYHNMSVKHMDKYLDEFEWRYNNRHNDYLFRDTLRALVKSEVLTYRRLIERPA